MLPMRLDSDALTDLVVLRGDTVAPAIALTAPPKSSTRVEPVQPQAFLFSNPNQITIFDSSTTPTRAEPYPSTISVAGLSGKLTKVRVGLNNLSHPRPSDIDILLVGPGGQSVLLMSDAGGGNAVNNVYLAFDDDANTSVPNSSGISAGTYKPTDINDGSVDFFPAPAPQPPFANALRVFTSSPNGIWSLYVVDDQVGNGGTITGGWSLSLLTDTSPPQSPPILVNNTNDSGPGSLRQAIIDANLNVGADTINFNISSGPQTITPASALPEITEALTIDATTQPGFTGRPIIEIDGTNTGPFSGGVTGVLSVNGGNSVIRCLVINRYNNSAIAILKNGSNIIEGNFIGTDIGGTVSKGVALTEGISIDTANNVVGGTTAAARNLISGIAEGVIFTTYYSDPATLNLVQGNFIGTDVTGTKQIANSHAGVSTRSAPGSPNNTIGGATPGARNLISGNTTTGVDIVYSGSPGTLVQGNFIGTDITGTKSLANSDGVEVDAPNSTVGGTSTAARNLLSGNTFQGILIRDTLSTGNLIQGNFIGTDVAGTAAVANGFYGVGMIFSATMNTIGGAVASARNIISGNTVAGIDVGATLRATTIQHLIQGNYMGTDFLG